MALLLVKRCSRGFGPGPVTPWGMGRRGGGGRGVCVDEGMREPKRQARAGTHVGAMPGVDAVVVPFRRVGHPACAMPPPPVCHCSAPPGSARCRLLECSLGALKLALCCWCGARLADRGRRPLHQGLGRPEGAGADEQAADPRILVNAAQDPGERKREPRLATQACLPAACGSRANAHYGDLAAATLACCQRAIACAWGITAAWRAPACLLSVPQRCLRAPDECGGASPGLLLDTPSVDETRGQGASKSTPPKQRSRLDVVYWAAVSSIQLLASVAGYEQQQQLKGLCDYATAVHMRSPHAWGEVVERAKAGRWGDCACS